MVAKSLARELEKTLSSDTFLIFLKAMYGNQPSFWSDDLKGLSRLRCICNYLTRMRFCDAKGALNFAYKGTLDKAPKALYPWYDVPKRADLRADLVFGHWAALQVPNPAPHIFAIDSGCYWGGELTALRLQDKKRFTVPGLAVNT